jgi:dTDP-4-amino-4,6-dideoxygalactose transaminase
VNPHQVTADFERHLCDYTGAPMCVVTTSCTMALLLAMSWFKRQHGQQTIVLPARTYVGVGMSVLNAGHKIAFRHEMWQGEYRLDPLPLWDSAKRLTSGMYRPGQMQCLSFHWTKHLNISQGGAILLDDAAADDYLRRARFDGRRAGVAPRDDTFDILGQHAYMSPSDAAEGITRLATLPKYNADLPMSDYSDLSRAPIFCGRGAKPVAEAAE